MQERFDRRVARLAATQHGVIARGQAARLGGTKRMIGRRIRAGKWERLARGVFRVAGAPPSWRQRLMAACLAAGGGGVISHRAAAALWRFVGFEPGAIELTIPRTRRRRGPDTIYQNALPSVDVTVVDRIPVTTPARTLIDLAAVAPRDAVEEALDDALRRGLVSIPRLRWRLQSLGRCGRPGVTMMRALIEARATGAPVPQSTFETKLLRTMRRSGLPEPVRQHPIRNGGRVVAIVDFAYPGLRLAIEADGYRWHSGRARCERDRARGNELTLLGWRVIHVTWNDLVREPQAVIDSIRTARASRASSDV